MRLRRHADAASRLSINRGVIQATLVFFIGVLLQG
jgi:hypothetical protein